MPKIYDYIKRVCFPDGGTEGQIVSLDSSGNKVWIDAPSGGSTEPGASELNDLTDVSTSGLENNDILKFDETTSTWINGNLDDNYLKKVDTEAQFDRLFVGDKTSETNKYIYADIGKSVATSSPSLRYAIDDPVAKTGHWEFSNDGEVFNALGQMELISDVKTFDGLAHDDYVSINFPTGVDSSFNRLITIYCKEIDPLDSENTIWKIFPNSPNFDGVGFDVLNYNDKTIIKNVSGDTKDIKIIIQYLAPNILNNYASITDTNGFLTLYKNGETKEISTNTYSVMYDEDFFADFERHDSIIYVGLVERVSEENSSGNCKIEITDGNNTVSKELGAITNERHKHTDIKLDCGFLNGTLKKWTIRISGMASSNSYIIERIIVKAKPTNIAIEDYVMSRKVNLSTTSGTYYQLDSFSFYGGYKIIPNSYFYVVLDYEISGSLASSSIQLSLTSGSASQSTTKQLDLTKNIVELRVKCPNILENVIDFNLKAKIDPEGMGSIKINSYQIYVEM